MAAEALLLMLIGSRLYLRQDRQILKPHSAYSKGRVVMGSGVCPRTRQGLDPGQELLEALADISDTSGHH